MAVLQASGISDLLKTTLENVEKLKFTDITSSLQRYIAMSRLMKKNKVVFDAGVDFNFDLMTDDDGSAQFVGLRAQDTVNATDVMVRATVPWRHITWNWNIERREVAMNRSPLKIVDMAMLRRIASFISAVKKFEVKFWRSPGSGNDVDPYGVPYWIVKNATEGFYGGLPSGHTTVAGLVPNNILNDDGTSRWANWTFQYTAITRDDLIRRMRKASEFVDFETPMPNMPTFNTGNDCAYYTTYAVRGAMVEILQGNNDNLGNELAKYQDSVMFMQKPVVWVPQLDEDTTNPVYGINWGEFKTAGLSGEWLHETVVPTMAGQHTVAVNFTDCTLNWFTHNRRRHFVGATGTTMPA